jgi:CxxC motif-containing protein (DUF1111 family)
LGGDTTTRHKNKQAFGQPVANLPLEKRTDFEVGDSLFNQNWVIAPASTTARDGLGPLFHARSCSGCHSRDGRGLPPEPGEDAVSLLVRLSKSGRLGPEPVPIYGDQLQPFAIGDAKGEATVRVDWESIPGTFPDGTSYELQKPIITISEPNYGPLPDDLMTSPRVAPHMIGMGLLEAIPEEAILANADPEDVNGDGVSGRANFVWDVEANDKRLGRFGWKANQPSVRQQVAGAFNGDMGLSTPIFPAQNHSPEQNLDHYPNGGDLEVEERQFNAVAFYSAHLAVPRQRNHDDPQVLRGAALFEKVGCMTCHVGEYTTGTTAFSLALANQTIPTRTSSCMTWAPASLMVALTNWPTATNGVRRRSGVLVFFQW